MTPGSTTINIIILICYTMPERLMKLRKLFVTFGFLYSRKKYYTNE